MKAKEILSYLQTTALRDLKMWGAKDFKLISSNEDNGGILFAVTGLLHTGHVLVESEQGDTYSVTIGKMVGPNFESAHQKFDKISKEEIVRVIDDLVEGSYSSEETEDDNETF